MSDLESTNHNLTEIPSRHRINVWLIASIGLILILFYPILDIIYYRTSFQKTQRHPSIQIRLFNRLSLLSNLDKKSSLYKFLFVSRYYQGELIEITDDKVKILIDGTSHIFNLHDGVVVLLDTPDNRYWVRTVLTAPDVGKSVTLVKGERLATSFNAVIITSSNE